MSNIKTIPFTYLSSESDSLMEEIKSKWEVYGYDTNCQLFNKAYVFSLDWCLQNNHRIITDYYRLQRFVVY
jgi:hypothetical protein